MEQQFQINSSEDLRKLFEIKKNETINACMKIAETEFDLLEFNLFISSIGNKTLNESTRKVRELRKKADNGKVDLSGYEDMLNDY